MSCSGRPAVPGSPTCSAHCARWIASSRRWRRTHAPAWSSRGGRPSGGRRDRCGRRPHLRRLRPVRRATQRARRRRTRRGAARRYRIPLRSRSRPDPQAERRSVPGVHPVPPLVGCQRLGRPSPVRSQRRRVADDRRRGDPRRPNDQCHIAGRRRDRRTSSVGTVPRRRAGGLRRPPRPPGPRRHLAHVAVPQTRRDPPTHAASRSRTR